MTSNMLTGERRWASARRGGMTVLGKVTVPKPINLPSQRLENHGLDPNVEIVPKGTHSWGSRSSSSTSNAWGSSTLSPNTDGGTGSPSYASGRPSSGGTGTRPSTAGSDRAHEPITNAWGSNSRPSSASGALASSQTSHASLRPRSADTRPGSSQLSRFAESSNDNSVAWAASGTAEKLGVASSKNDSFSLTSGDFPTLGSEKEASGKSMDSQEHGSNSRPGSSSSCVIPGKESSGNSVGDPSVNANVKSGAANSWRRENVPYGEDGARPGIEKWHNDPHIYPNSGIPPQHYDAWHGSPVNNHPGGVWYRGPPGGPPFGSPVPPNGFPMEPFPYYRPQIPPAALANPQPVPPPGAGPRGGPHPKSGDMYRPHLHEAYIRAGMPLRPGFYPGPVPYEGYYGPPMGYCNSNERDIPFMGMGMGPAPYNRYASQNAADASNSHARSSGYGPNGKRMVLEQVESTHSQDTRGPYKVLLKQHDGWEGKDEELKWDDTANASHPGKGEYPKSSWDNDWRGENKKDEEMGARRMRFGDEGSSEAVDNSGVFPMKLNSSENVGSMKASDDNSVKKLEAEHAASAFPEVSITSKDPSLIKKIEGLNAKARASDGRQDVRSASTKEEHKNKSHAGNPKFDHSAAAPGSGSASLERTHASGIMDSLKSHISAADKGLESTVTSGMAASRRPSHAMNDRADRGGRGRFGTSDADAGWKKPHVSDIPSGESSLQFGSASVVSFAAVPENAGSYPQGKDDRESMPTNSDSSDTHAQRAKMKELAKQRHKQREKEEEERLRDQKARALAKLEELNRRTQAGEILSQKSETVPSSAGQNNSEQLPSIAQPAAPASKSRATISAIGSKANAVTEADNSATKVEKSTSLSSEVPQATETALKESDVVHDQSDSGLQDVSKVDAPHFSNSLPIHETGLSRQKRVGYKQKQTSSLEKNPNEKLISSSTIDVSKGNATSDVTTSGIVSGESVSNEVASSSESSLLVSESVMAESPVPQRKKSRGGKNKHKVEESSAVSLSSMGTKDTTALDSLVESNKRRTPEPALDPISIKSVMASKDSIKILEQRTSSLTEEGHNRINNQLRSQHPRRMPKNLQASKSTEKFHCSDAVVWAPVRSQNKTMVIDEVSEKTVVEVGVPATRNDQQVQNNPRNRRAEMERYIPKPVAKEMAQHGSTHQSAAPGTNQIMSDVRPDSCSQDAEGSQTSDTGMGKVGSGTEFRNGDGRQNKPGKVHGSWIQRGSSESIFTSNPSRNFKKEIEVNQPEKPDSNTVNEQSSCVDEWGISDGWNIPDKPDATSASFVKDCGMTARGKRHLPKGHKAGHNYDPSEKRMNNAETDQSSSLEMMCQGDLLPVTSKENRAVGERSTTHWQPKASNQRGSRSSGGQNAGAEIGRPNKKDSTSQSQIDQDEHIQDKHISVKGNFEEASSDGNQEAKKERKVAPYKGQPDRPAEPSSNRDFRHEQRTSSGFRKNGHQNSRFGRDEYHGDWSGYGKDNRQHNVPANKERQRHSSHYEYQQVGAVPHNNFESSKEGLNSSTRYKDRGQGHSRRGGGNFYGRQSGGVRVDANYE